MENTLTLLMILVCVILVGLVVIWCELRAYRPFRPDLRRYDVTFADQEECFSGDDPLIDVLHQALGNRTGKLRVSDAYLICGIEVAKVNQAQIARFGRAIRDLGWKRARRRFGGSLQYAHTYVKGTDVEQEVELLVEYDPHMRSVRIEARTSEYEDLTKAPKRRAP